MATISVLSIDGGGIRGMIPAAFLNRLEQRTGHRVSDLFDYVAGTSTGGILALGLGANRPGCNSPYTAEQLVRLYKTEGGRIFSRSLLHFARALDNLNGPRFPEYGIDEVLKRYSAIHGSRMRARTSSSPHTQSSNDARSSSAAGKRRRRARGVPTTSRSGKWPAPRRRHPRSFRPSRQRRRTENRMR